MDKKKEIGTALIKRFESMKTTRLMYENVFKDIDKFILNKPTLFSTMNSEGQIENEDVYDTTAIIANDMLASTLHSGLTSTAKKWFDLSPKDNRLKNIDRVKRWIDDVVLVMLSVFNSPESNFAQQNHEALKSLTSYGTCCMYIDMSPTGQVKFSTRDMSEIYIMEDHLSRVDTVFRHFQYTARQALQEFGKEALGEKLLAAYGSDPDKKFNFIHACVPAKDAEQIYNDMENLPDMFNYIAYTVSVDDKVVVQRKGYTDLPYKVGRFDKLPCEVYGRSPAWKALPDIKLLNKISESELKALQLATEPIWGIPDDSIITEMNLYPNGVIPGAISPEGRQLVVPLNTGVRPNVADLKVMRLQDSVRRAFMVHEYFQKEGTPLTATEINKKIQDSQILGSPNQFRIRAEYLSPIVNRVFGLLLNNGKLPPIPQELVDERGGLEYEIEYVSPFVRQQRFDELDSINRAIQSAAPILQMQPDVMDVIDGEKWFRLALDISGVPLSVIREYDVDKSVSLDDFREQKAQGQQQQMAMQAQMEAASRGVNSIPQ